MTKPVIFTNGCFDIIHRGHLELLKYCSELGFVVVGLNSDASIRRLKGPTRPINKELDRKFILESLKFVDRVEIFDEDTPLELIRAVNPEIIVKGGDYSSDQVIGKNLAEVRIFQFIEGYSTSKVVEKIKDQN